MRISYTDWEDYFLIAIAEADESSGGMIGSLEEVAKQTGYDVPKNWIEKAIDSLEANEYLKTSRTTGPTRAFLTGEGLKAVEKIKRNKRPFYRISVSAPRAVSFSKFSDFRDSLLVALAENDEESAANFRDLKEIANQNGLKFRKGWVEKAAKSFRDMGYIQAAFTMANDLNGGLGARLTGDGLAAAEELLTDRTIAPEESPHPSVPASDRYVELDHNSPEYKESIKAIDKVISAVDGDNEYGDRAPEEKAAIVAALRAGRELLTAAKVKISAVHAVLISSLQYVADNFTKGVVAALGAAAVGAVLKLLGAV